MNAPTCFSGRRPSALSAAAALCLAILVAGCGGSSSSTTSSTAVTTPATSPTSAPASTTGASSTKSTKTSTKKTSGSKSSTKPTSTPAKKGVVHKTKGFTNPQKVTKPTKVVFHGANPCLFISRAEAQAVIGTPITAEAEAPLGPTCIFDVKGGREPITMAVETLNYAKTIKVMRNPKPLTIGGDDAVCGVLGRPMVYVSLSGGKVLNVTASCPIAEGLAAKALPNVKT